MLSSVPFTILVDLDIPQKHGKEEQVMNKKQSVFLYKYVVSALLCHILPPCYNIKPQTSQQQPLQTL